MFESQHSLKYTVISRVFPTCIFEIFFHGTLLPKRETIVLRLWSRNLGNLTFLHSIAVWREQLIQLKAFTGMGNFLVICICMPLSAILIILTKDATISRELREIRVWLIYRNLMHLYNTTKKNVYNMIKRFEWSHKFDDLCIEECVCDTRYKRIIYGSFVRKHWPHKNPHKYVPLKAGMNVRACGVRVLNCNWIMLRLFLYILLNCLSGIKRWICMVMQCI